jgi:hypothetical protein
MQIDWSVVLDRSIFLGVGCVIGFFLGRMKISLDDTREDVHRLMEDKQGREHDKDEAGGVSIRSLLSNIVLALVVLLVAFGAIKTNQASNRSDEAVAELRQSKQRGDAENQCVSATLFTMARALNERTTYSTEQANANIALQNAQLNFIQVLLSPSKTDSDARIALSRYYESLQKFRDLVGKSAAKASVYQYPTPDQFADCLRDARDGKLSEATIDSIGKPPPSPPAG